MPKSRTTLLVPALAALTCAASSCADDSAALAWRLRFQPRELATHARIITGDVLVGGCDGTLIFSTDILGDGNGAAPGSLPPGRYGFRARAQDDQCNWFAEGCETIELPRRDAIDLVLSPAASPSIAPGCVGTAEAGNVASMLGDADTRPTLAGDSSVAADPRTEVRARDADVASPEASSGAAPSEPLPLPSEPGKASGPPSAALKCQALDMAVVACFDFEGSLADASSRHNDPSAGGVGFESGLASTAVRVGGRRVAIPDAPSLDFSAFTVELWLRSDGLQNLSSELDDRSVLVDKDKQYTVSHEPTGALGMEIHTPSGTFELIASDRSSYLSTFRWVYVAASYDGAVASLYKDGQRVEAKFAGVPMFRGIGSALHIGSGSPGTTRTFDGLIDALRISNVARGDAEICAAAGKQLEAGLCK